MDKKTEDRTNAFKKDLRSSRTTENVPLDPERILQNNPATDNVNEATVHNVLINYLKEQRFSGTPPRLNVETTKVK